MAGKLGVFCVVLSLASVFCARLLASEIIAETDTQVLVREHPKTGKAYVSIVSRKKPITKEFFDGQKQYTVIRPDYRLLDPKVKSDEIAYQGPYNNRTKVYIFAASVATVGAVGGAAGLAFAPAATGVGGGAGGAGAYAVGGAAVLSGAAGIANYSIKPDPNRDDFEHTSQSISVKEDGISKS